MRLYGLDRELTMKTSLNHNIRYVITRTVLIVSLLLVAPFAHANVAWDSMIWNTDVWAGDDPDDPDLDLVLGSSDNCPFHANADQANLDGDGLGNVCDPDADGDGLDTAAETQNGTLPLNPDTDGDGRTDGAEVAAGQNPTVNEGAVVINIIRSLIEEE